MQFRCLRRFAVSIPLFVLGSLLSAQVTEDTIYFETQIGSFKLLNCKGELNFKFQGTVLISGMDGTITPTGSLKREYTNEGQKGITKATQRIAYFGTGALVLKGKWRGVQWFGTGMSGSFAGNGIMRMSGEFDKNMNTGHYWYKSDPTKQIWYNSGIERTIPPNAGRNVGKPVRKGGGG
jgi:hypothetical protein